ncbi:MAG TPA: ATP-dependent helicase [Ktedonobacterales bacterium]
MDGLDRPRLVAEKLLDWWAGRDDTAGAAPSVDALDLDGLVTRLGLGVATFAAAMRPDTLGYLEPGEDLIFLRDNLPEGTRRFTLAHELGHALLHRTSGAPASLARQLLGQRASPSEPLEPCLDRDIDIPLELAAGLDEVLMPGHAYSARSHREAEANAFAAALLLPLSALSRLYLDVSGAPPNTNELAMRLGVPEDVLLRRLAALLVSDELTATAAPTRAPAAEPRSPLDALDPEQRAACEGDAPALVIAGPGTGKTSTLVGRAAYLVTRAGVPAGRILALTFSNKAATEMRERLTGMLTSLAPDGDERPFVSTIHAFCGDLLRRHGHLIGLRPDFRLRTDADGFLLLRAITGSAPLRHYQPVTAPTSHFRDLLQAFSRAKDDLRSPDDYLVAGEARLARARTVEERVAAEKVAEVAVTWAAYQRRLSDLGDLDFGDVLGLAVKLLHEQPEILAEVRDRYTHILVDEFQDINRAMGILLRTLAGTTGAIWAVGDPDQAIYRFRGASPANIARFKDDYPQASEYPLRQNYRSYQQILDAAARLAGNYLGGGERTPLRAQRGTGKASPVLLAEAPDGTSELAGIVSGVREHLRHGRSLTDIAILCRTRKHTQEVTEALREAELPVRIVAPLLEQPDVKDVLAIVSLLAEPSGGGLLRAGELAAHRFSREEALVVIEAARQRDLAPVVVLRDGLIDVQGLSAGGRMGLLSLSDALRAMRYVPDIASGLARYVFGLTDLGRDLMLGAAHGDPSARERALHLARLLTLARTYEDQRLSRDAGGAAWADFLDYVRVLATVGEENKGGEDLYASADEGIWVLTVHASKGLEFPVVYLPNLTNGRFPTNRHYDPVPLPAELADTAGVEEDDPHLVDEACLFYVALTRARDELVLSWAHRYGKRKEAASRFLKPVEAALGSRLRRAQWPEVTRATPAALSAGATGGSDTPEQHTFTAREIEDYASCPRRYAYQRVWGLRGSSGGSGALTRAVNVVQRELLLHPAGALPTLADVEDRFDTQLAASLSGGEPDPFEELYRREGRAMVERMWHEAQQRPVDEPTRHEVDQQADVRVGGFSVSVPLDRVEHSSGDGLGDGGPQRLMRQRMSRGRGEADLRAYFYQLAAEQAGGHAPQVSSVSLPTGDVVPITMTAQKRASLQEQALEAIEGINARQYPARPEPRRCLGCPFLFVCPA